MIQIEEKFNWNDLNEVTMLTNAFTYKDVNITFSDPAESPLWEEHHKLTHAILKEHGFLVVSSVEWTYAKCGLNSFYRIQLLKYQIFEVLALQLAMKLKKFCLTFDELILPLIHVDCVKI